MRVVVVGLLVGMMGVLSSCGREKSYPANDVLIADARFDPGPAVVIDEPGRMHNDIVAAFFRHWPDDPAQQTPERMVTALTAAFNEVLPGYGGNANVAEGDTRALLQAVVDLWTLAGFDPTAPDADPGRIANALVERGDITREEFAFVQQYLLEARGAGTPVSNRPPPTARVAAFVDITAASEQLWTSGEYATIERGSVRGFLTKVVDGLMALSKLGPIARLLGSASASILFEMAWNGAVDYFGDHWCPCP
jgi:hypothetical protein